VLKKLLQNGAEGAIDTPDNELMTALHWAAFHQKSKHVGLLAK
jgi:hypothetical protein